MRNVTLRHRFLPAQQNALRADRRFVAAAGLRTSELFVNDGFEAGATRQLAKKFGFQSGKAERVFDRQLEKAVKGTGSKALAEAREAATALVAAAPAQAQANGGKSKHGPTDFNISSFNVLGSSHTRPGGEHPGFASGKARIHDAVKLIKKHDVDVVGFQELQGDQLKEFQRVTDNKFGVYPGAKLGKRASENSIAWRKDTWDLVKPDTVTIPYFNGTRREMPVVLLQNKETGQRAYFTNFHNPADTRRFHNQGKYRAAAAKIESDLVNDLQKKTGLPVFLTGDMNEQKSYYDKLTAHTSMEAANKRPHGPLKKVGIDWIFGSKGVKFSDYVRDRSRLARKASDHPMIVSHATIRG